MGGYGSGRRCGHCKKIAVEESLDLTARAFKKFM